MAKRESDVSAVKSYVADLFANYFITNVLYKLYINMNNFYINMNNFLRCY